MTQTNLRRMNYMDFATFSTCETLNIMHDDQQELLPEKDWDLFLQ